MKIFSKEVRSSGRCIYRIAGVKAFSLRRHPVSRLSQDGRSVLVVRIPGEGVGLFCHYNFCLGWKRWAEEHGYRCYVDMRTPVNAFNRDGAITFNPWDIFFRQDCDAVDLLSAKEVLVNDSPAPPLFPGMGKIELFDQDSAEFLAWRAFAHAHGRISEQMTRLADKRQTDLFKGETEVLGCCVRGTDYVKMKPIGHPVQPTAEQAIADAKRICAERGLKRIFLATEDVSIREKFQQAFGSALIVNQTDFPNYADKSLVQSGALGDSRRILEISRQYLVSIVLLSRCPCLLAGCTSGSMGAALLSKGFDLMQFYNLGYYR